MRTGSPDRGSVPTPHDRLAAPRPHRHRRPPKRCRGAPGGSRSRPPVISSRARGRWLVLTATVFWGTSATLARFMFRERKLSPIVVVEMRLIVAVVLLAGWLALRKPGLLRIRRADLGTFVV